MMITRFSGLAGFALACWRCMLGYFGSSMGPVKPAASRTMCCISGSGILP